MGSKRAASTAALAAEVDTMTLDDLPEVMAIDESAFPRPWPEASWRYEISGNRTARCFVARSPAPQRQRTLLQRLFGTPKPTGRVVTGMVCMWVVVDEAHVATIATHEGYRRRGVGALLLKRCIAVARQESCVSIMLEVRVSNQAAQELYREHGFTVTGMRQRYYSDNGEDALVMTRFIKDS